MNEGNVTCAAIRPLLFAALEGEISAPERLDVHAHLATCERCRSWEHGERALTALLVDARLRAGRRRPLVRRTQAVAAAVLLCAATLLLLPAAVPDGSLVQRRLGPDLGWHATPEKALQPGEIVDVPAAEAATVRLGDDATLEAVGPAQFVCAYAGRGWSLAVVRGSVLASLRAAGRLEATGVGDLGPGRWVIATDGVRQDPQVDTEALLSQGISRFGAATPALAGGATSNEQALLRQSEGLLRQVLERRDLSADQHRRAEFYLACSLSRQHRADDAFALYEDWLQRFPDGSEASLVRHYAACHLKDKGEVARARELFLRVVRDEGDTPLRAAARTYLQNLDAGPQDRPDERDAHGAGDGAHHATERAGATRSASLVVPTVPTAGGYHVVTVDLDAARDGDRGFLAAAAAARAFHRGDLWAWDGGDFAALAAHLRERGAENVLFVLRPDALDLPLHRRVLLLSRQLDADPFVDFAFGYLTAQDGPGCEQLWRRIETVHRRGRLHGRWWQASVTTNAASLRLLTLPPAADATVFAGVHYYYSIHETAAVREQTIAQSLADLRGAQVVEFTGNGDPQGIWLFDDQRNLRSDLHWAYDPARVGEDPHGEMPRLLAARFRGLELDAPILWSGTCHSGAVARVYVEDDIVSTFGHADRTTVHCMAPADSLALAWLHAGAASMLVPLGANHGMSVSMEQEFALRFGASLGETIKSTYDDVLLAADGALQLDLPVAGAPHGHREHVMQGGGCNRILIGDPALRPFAPVAHPDERVQVERTDQGLRVVVTRGAGFVARAWDIFGEDRAHDQRVLARVDLTALGLDGATSFTAGVHATSAAGAAVPCFVHRLAIENHLGRRYLHLQANGTRAELAGKAATFVFDVASR